MLEDEADLWSSPHAFLVYETRALLIDRLIEPTGRGQPGEHVKFYFDSDQGGKELQIQHSIFSWLVQEAHPWALRVQQHRVEIVFADEVTLVAFTLHFSDLRVHH